MFFCVFVFNIEVDKGTVVFFPNIKFNAMD